MENNTYFLDSLPEWFKPLEIKQRERAEKFAHFVRKHCQDRDHYIDIGACIGLTTLSVIDMFKRIDCIELDPNNRLHLRKNLQDYAHVWIHNSGFGSVHRQSIETLRYNNGLLNCVKSTSMERLEKHTIVNRHIERFDMFRPKTTYVGKAKDGPRRPRFSLIKINVNGHELEILKGGKRALDRSPNPLVVVTTHKPLEVTEFMTSINFRKAGRISSTDFIYIK